AARTVLSSTPVRPIVIQTARPGLALAAVQRDDTAAAEEQYAALTPMHGTAAWRGLGLAIDRILGLLAHTMGRLDDAAHHFDDALAFCRKAGYRPELAWSLCDYADMLLDASTSSAQAGENKPGQSDKSETTVRGEPVEPQHASTSRGQAGRTDEDKTKAVAMLDESLAISTELGMRPLMERVLSRREILKA
ncbi:MAG: hypothetical protein IH861_13940, partial [Chloroflexi bacterium]|nr:hypothetical protein [Chloroflexota bacterium]